MNPAFGWQGRLMGRQNHGDLLLEVFCVFLPLVSEYTNALKTLGSRACSRDIKGKTGVFAFPHEHKRNKSAWTKTRVKGERTIPTRELGLFADSSLAVAPDKQDHSLPNRTSKHLSGLQTIVLFSSRNEPGRFADIFRLSHRGMSICP